MMKKVLLLLLSVLCVSVAMAQKYTFEGESLSVYNSTHQQVIAMLPAGSTMEITNDKGDEWVQVRTSTDPAILGWVQRSDIYKIEESVKPELDATSDALSEIFDKPLGGLLRVLLLCVLLSFYALVIYFMVFFVRFIFMFRNLTNKFNRKAGMNIMPQDRLDKRLWSGLPFFVLLTIPMIIISKMQNITLALITLGLAFVYLIILINRNAEIFGSRRAARWYVLYIIMAGYSVFFVGMLLWWALLFYLVFKLVYTFVTSPSNVARCEDCGYCERYIDGNYYCERLRSTLVEIRPKNEACRHFYRK